MPNRVFYEKLREKRRLARERAQKVQEERRRAREMKEEKWTTRNEFELVSEHRQMQRKEYIEKIRNESQEMIKMALARMKANEEREMMIAEQIESEIKAMEAFTEEQCSYYEEIHNQISPPEERSVDQIVAEIVEELREIYDVFASVSDFDPKMPETDDAQDEEDHIFAKDIAQMQKEFAENTIKGEVLKRKISEAKKNIDTENVRYAAVEQEKAMELLKLEKRIKETEAKLDFMRQDPVEKEELDRLKEAVEEESKKTELLQETLEKVKDLIRWKQAEKTKKAEQ